jgi:hypothetical protein
VAYEMKENSGSLWVNDRKDKDEPLDRAVSIMVEGGEDWINGWLRKTKDGSRACRCR